MTKIIEPLFIICETPLHVGVGSDLGIIDLPIQRERVTNYPKIESSGLKGAIRSAFESDIEKIDKAELMEYLTKIQLSFGYDGDDKRLVKVLDNNKGQYSGAIGFSDARILLFPVKSLKGSFAWITCPNIMNKFFKELNICEIKENKIIENNTCSYIEENKNNKIILKSSITISPPEKDKENEIILEDFLIKVKPNKDTKELAEYLSEVIFPKPEKDKPDEYKYWKKLIKTNLVILDDEDFKNFVTLSTEVITRIKINNETGTVKDTGLFTEEYLPSESILYTLSMFNNLFSDAGDFKDTNYKKDEKKHNENNPYWERGTKAQEIKNFFYEKPLKVIQIGGNATLGKGIVRLNKYSVPTATTTENKEDSDSEGNANNETNN
ncbi:MAG: type III-B CRISPR module RAMP protein Cmr4 [Cyanobacteriota bacterium]